MRLFVFFLAGLACAADASLILHNGRIVSADSAFRVVEAVAIQGNRIARTGSSAEVLAAERGPRSKVIDLKGRMVLPGLIDSHVHAPGAALSEFRSPLPPLDSFAAVQAYIRKQAAATPKGQWIVVPRTFPTRLKEMRMPTKEVLDVAGGHPVLFDASYVWVVNSMALRISGITRETPDPTGGEIGRDERGEPNGILRNAGSLLKNPGRRETFSEAERLDALEQMLKRYVAAGLTAIGERAVTAPDVALFEKLLASERLPIRTVLTWRLDASKATPAALEEIRSSTWTTNQGRKAEWLKFGPFKVTLDGGMTIGTAYQRYPYGSFGRQLYGTNNPDNRGQLFIPPDKLHDLFSAARDKGWQLTAHSQGGGAIDALLDAFEALDKRKPLAPTRSHLMHASFQNKEAIERLAKLKLPADVQAAWLYLDAPALEQVFGREGMRYFFPLKTYRDHGIILAGGSDHMIGFDKNTAVNPYNPFLAMWTAVTRKMSNGAVLFAEEAIGREDALRMYTNWAAWLQFDEKTRGSIEAGKLADLVVIDRDYLTCPPDEIRHIEPLATMIDGNFVWRKAGFNF